MIKFITVTNYLGESIKLELTRPELSGFVIESIKGLGPGEATINTTEVSTNDGSLFNSSRLPSRNIVIAVKYLFKNSIEDVRQLSYKHFPIKKKLTLTIETDNRYVETEGYVESNEPNIFSKEEGSDISIICPNPFFYSAGEKGKKTTVFSGVEAMFEFPFYSDMTYTSYDELESYTYDQLEAYTYDQIDMGLSALPGQLIEFGSIQIKKEQVITYDGDSEIGVTITIHALGPASKITIYNTKTREVMKIDTDKLAAFTGHGIIKSDDIIISTIKGNKSITLLREGVTTNILNCLEKKPAWFQLAKGDNIFAYEAETGNENLQFKIENRIIYEGV